MVEPNGSVAPHELGTSGSSGTSGPSEPSNEGGGSPADSDAASVAGAEREILVEQQSALALHEATQQFEAGNAASATDPIDLQILTINDFHGRIEANFAGGEAGAAVLAGAVNHFRAQNPNTLFVSAGDNIGASTFTSFIDRDNPTIDALAAAGLAVSAVGNHEFDQGVDDLLHRVTPRFGGPQFSLGANVYAKGTSTPALQEFVVEDVGGVRVAFIGTVTSQTASMVRPSGIATIDFGDQLAAANRVATRIDAENLADVTVLLTHEGSFSSDCAVIAAEQTAYGALIRDASPAIDAIVSGHTHQRYACEIGGRPVMQAHQYGTTLGTLELRVDPVSRELLSIAAGLVPLVADGAAAFEADPAVAAIVAAATENAEAEGSVEVGAISADILRGGTPPGSDRGAESSIGNLIADIYLWAASNESYGVTPAVIGMMNPGGLRADLLYRDDGRVSYRDIANVQPFANTLVTVSLSGAQLKSVLEEQWYSDELPSLKRHLGISQGFGYVYDPDAPRGSRVLTMTLHGQPIDPTAQYVVVTHSYLAAGGDDIHTFPQGAEHTDTGQVDLQATVAYFEQHPIVDPAPLGRAIAHVDDGSGGGEHPVPGGEPLAATGAAGAPLVLGGAAALLLVLGAAAIFVARTSSSGRERYLSF